VQRLFSSFADGSPGAGLLLLRLLTGGGLLYGGIGSAWSAPYLAMAPPIIAGSAGVLLLLGLYTPFAGVVAAIAEVWIAFSHPGNLWAPIGLICLGLSLAMIGPGAWSIDARLFGMKQIDPSTFESESDRARKW
jgi:putative oxidoreductase